MIVLLDKDDPDKAPLRMHLVDTHTHLGKEEVVRGKGKDYRIIRPKDHLDFYEKLKFDLFKRMNDYPEDFAYKPPSTAKMFSPPATRLQKIIFEEQRKTQNLGWLADKIVSFPLHDILLAKTSPKFVKSNDYIITRAQTFEYGSRLVPFCRVDPMDGEAAVAEIKRCSEHGARGLKLHPLSEKWLDEIVSEKVFAVVQTAIEHRLPVIFDCQNYQTAQEIHQVTMTVRERTDVKDFTVIIGHFGFDYQTPGMFEILDDPNIKTETSGMRGDDCEIFYRNCMNLTETWEQSTMYGTDHNYFSVPQASDHLSFLFSYKAKEMGLTEEHLKHILGLNALKNLKIYWPTKVIQRKGINDTKVSWNDFNRIKKCKTQGKLAEVITELCSKSGVYFNTDFLFDPSGEKVFDELYILNVFADIIDLRRSFVVQNLEANAVKVSEVTKLVEAANKITEILEEQTEEYPFTTQYLFNYLLHQKPKG
ncbi:MAG: amidohydrolase family protein [Candidatus Heimdallarchaeota archaeon]|nr:amidohydrolase family protein [Candidatus Heimdallarchaeota archaeon]